MRPVQEIAMVHELPGIAGHRLQFGPGSGTGLAEAGYNVQASKSFFISSIFGCPIYYAWPCRHKPHSHPSQ